MTRIGKIARLPHHVREELNCRLQDGEDGANLLDWLNSQTSVHEVLSARFGGRAVNEQNLSAWRQGGYQDWLAHQEIVVQVEQLATNAAELKGMAKNTQLTEHLATLVAVRYAEVLANPHHEPDDEQWERKVKTLRSLCRDVIAMRKSDQRGERLGMERERWAFECHDLEEKRLARERAKARAAELAPFDAQVQQSILAKVHGEEGAARVAEIMHDLPAGTVYYNDDEGDEDGEGEETLNIEHRTSNIEGESSLSGRPKEEEGEHVFWWQKCKEVLADGHQADGQSEGESRSIKVDQGSGEAGSEFRVQGSELKEGERNPLAHEPQVIPDRPLTPALSPDGGEGEETLNIEHRTSNTEGQSSLSRPPTIKADQGGGEDGSEFRVPGSELPAKVLADGQANGHEKAQSAQDESEDGESRMEDGEGDDDEEGEDGEGVESTDDDGWEEDGGIDIQETALRLAASQICQILGGFKLEKGLLENDPKNYAAITSCLAKLSKGALDIEKFRESVAEQRHQRQVELDKAKKPRGLSRETIRKMEEALHLM